MIDKFKAVLKYEGITAKDFCLRIGIKYGSFRTLIAKEGSPRWVKAFMLGYKLGKVPTDIKKIEVIEPKTIKP
jgi:hypothetical protein